MRRAELTPEILSRMSPEDQARYGVKPPPSDDEISFDTLRGRGPKAYAKTDSTEKAEQLEFLAHIQAKDYPYCWHRTDKGHTANVGVPDFIVGVNGQTLWIEFKRPGFTLSQAQEQFRQRLLRQNISLHIVYSGKQAIELTMTHEQSVR